MKYFSLFSGIGGFELGIQKAYEDYCGGQSLREQCGNRENIPPNRDFPNDKRAGAKSESICDVPENIGYSEIDKYAVQIYEKHFPYEECEACRVRRIQSDDSQRPGELNNTANQLEQRELSAHCNCRHKNYGDITRIRTEELPGFDLLVGGFPCQSFSIAGKRGGFTDTRGTLFFEIARILRDKQPPLLLLENVKGLLSHDEGRTFGTILNTLDELGYDLQWQVLNSKNHGVPQNRERVFIIGHLRGTSRPEVFPFGETNGIYQEINSGEREEVANSLKAKQGGPDADITLIKDAALIRRLTPTECERLQGFPDGWTEGISDTQRYKCLGNAVTVNVVKAIVEKLASLKG